MKTLSLQILAQCLCLSFLVVTLGCQGSRVAELEALEAVARHEAMMNGDLLEDARQEIATLKSELAQANKKVQEAESKARMESARASELELKVQEAKSQVVAEVTKSREFHDEYAAKTRALQQLELQTQEKANELERMRRELEATREKLKPFLTERTDQ